MKITRTSTLTGMKHTLDVPCTPLELEAFELGIPIQLAMPTVSPEWREFVLSGITPTEWDNYVLANEELNYSINPLNPVALCYC
jgi:hypothetical protein